MRRQLIYVAHPYGGKESNKQPIDTIMRELVRMDAESVYISPIHNFGYMYLEGDRYIEGLNYCLHLLGECDALVVCKDYASSRGCCAEYGFAKGRGKDIYTLTEWKEQIIEFNEQKKIQELVEG